MKLLVIATLVAAASFLAGLTVPQPAVFVPPPIVLPQACPSADACMRAVIANDWVCKHRGETR